MEKPDLNGAAVRVYVCVISEQALMSLFVLASKDGWVNIMYSGLDAVGVDLQVRIAYLTTTDICLINVLAIGLLQFITLFYIGLSCAT